MSNPEQLTGVFLSFAEDELTDLYDRLESMGYPRDGKGLREFIVQSMYEDPEPEPGEESSAPVNRLFNYVRENPDQVRLAAGTAAAFCKSLFVRRG